MKKADKKIQIFASKKTEPLVQLIDKFEEDGYSVSFVRHIDYGKQLLTVVVLSDELIELIGGKEIADESLSRLGTNFVPITDSEKAYSKLFGEKSQLPLLLFGITRAAKRIELIADVGQETIGAWNSLHAHAHEWDVNGRSVSDLLRSNQIASSELLLTKPVSELENSGKELVSGYVMASKARAVKVRRRAIIIAGFFVAILLVSGIVAIAGRTTAVSATKQATNNANSSQANRLSSNAINLMGQNPDLPWILSSNALSASPTSPAVSDAYEVAQNEVPHKSFKIGKEVSSLKLIPSEKTIVGLADGQGYSIINIKTGKIEKHYQTSNNESGTTQVSVNPSGTVATAVEKNGFSQQINLKDQNKISNIVGATKTSGIFEWIDDNFAVTKRGNFLAIYNAKMNSIENLQVPTDWDNSNKIVSYSVDRDDKWLAVATNSKIFIYSLESYKNTFVLGSKALITLPIEGSNQQGVSNSNNELQNIEFMPYLNQSNVLGILYSHEIDVIDVSSMIYEKENTNQATTEISSVNSTIDLSGFEVPSAKHLLVSQRQNIMMDDLETGEASKPVSQGDSLVASISALSDSEWAVGTTNGYVRVYSSSLINGIDAPAEAVNQWKFESGFGSTNRIFQESSRNTLAFTSSNHKEIGLNSPNAIYETISTNPFKMIQAYSSVGMDVSIRQKVAPDNGNILAVLDGQSEQPELSVYNLSNKGTLLNSQLTANEADNSVFGLSLTGNAVALATSSELKLWDLSKSSEQVTPKTVELKSTDDPIYVGVLSAQNAGVITQSGTLTWNNGKSENLFGQSTLLNAATIVSNNLIFTLDNKGNLYAAVSGQKSIKILSISPSLQGYALKVSDDNKYIAIIGKQGTEIYKLNITDNNGNYAVRNMNSDQLSMKLNPIAATADGLPINPVDDVLFDGTKIYCVRASGLVQTYNFMSIAQLQQYMKENTPRELTSIEKLIYEPEEAK